MNRPLKWALIVAGIISALVPVVLSFGKAVWVDPAVILVEMERIAEGYVPYKTMHLNYPPLWFYMMVGLKTLFGVPYGCYNFYLAIHYVFLFGCVGFVYGISRQFGAAKKASLFVSWLTVMVAIWMNGDMIMFEVPTLFFGLGALYAALRCRLCGVANYIWIGTLSACAFLVKQFGAGFLILVLYVVVVLCDDRRVARALCYSLGVFLPIAVCVMIWGQDIINSLVANGYGGNELRAMCGDTSSALERVLYATVFFCMHVPVVILPFVFVGVVVRLKLVKEVLFCLFGIGGFLLSFIFLYSHTFHVDGGDLHYMLLSMPFAMIMAALFLSVGKESKVCFVCAVAVVSALGVYSLYKIYRFNVREDLSGERAEQIEMGRMVAAMIPSGRTVWIVNCDDEYLYYFANLITADMKNFAYSTGGFEISADEARSEVRLVDYVISRENLDVGGGWLHYYDRDVAEYVSLFPSKTLDVKHGVMLYDMSSECGDEE